MTPEYLKNTNIGRFLRRPVLLFPEGWAEGWAHPEIEDGTIPLFIAEAYIAKVAENHAYPFVRFASFTTPLDWRKYREMHYGALMTNPFGYDEDGPLCPWGVSVHGVCKLHPEDE